MLFSQSVFLQSLGWAIANSLWQMALLWLIYQVIFAFNKKSGSHVKNLSGIILLLGGFAWFLITAVEKAKDLSRESAVILFGDATVRKYIETSQSFNTSGAIQNWFRQFFYAAERYLPYLSIAYLLVLVVLAFRLINLFYSSRNLKRYGLHSINDNWSNYFRSLVVQIGISRNVQLWLSEKISVPGTLGFLKPVVLLPVASINQLSPEQLEAILLHELAHIRRWDYLWNLLITIADTVLFFNPFAHLLYNICCRERENSCDDVVISYRQDPEVYVSALLSLEKNRVCKHQLAMAATSGKYQLLYRVRRILNVPSSGFNYGQRLIALVLTAGALSSLAWFVPDKSKTMKAVNEQQRSNSLLQRRSPNQIELSPVSIEKDKKGNLVLTDAQKKEVLIVKPDKKKIKVQNPDGKLEFLGDKLELKEPSFPQEVFQHLPAIAEESAKTISKFKVHPFGIAGQQFSMSVPPPHTFYETVPPNLAQYFGQINELEDVQENATAINKVMAKAKNELRREKDRIDKQLAGKEWQGALQKLELELEKNGMDLTSFYRQIHLQDEWMKELDGQLKHLELQWKEDSLRVKDKWNAFFKEAFNASEASREKKPLPRKKLQFTLNLDPDGNYRIIAVPANPPAETRERQNDCTCDEKPEPQRKKVTAFHYKYQMSPRTSFLLSPGKSASGSESTGASAEEKDSHPRVRVVRNNDNLIEVVITGDN